MTMSKEEQPINYIPTDYETITVLVSKDLHGRIAEMGKRHGVAHLLIARRGMTIGIEELERAEKGAANKTTTAA